jgi:hypothetical protein
VATLQSLVDCGHGQADQIQKEAELDGS